MNRKLPGNVVAVILGVILGIFVLVFRTIWRLVSGKPDSGEEATGIGDQARQAFEDVRQRSEDVIDETRQRADDLLQRGEVKETEEEQVEFGFPPERAGTALEPDVAAGEETVVQGTGDRTAELTSQQHGELGGIPDEGAEPEDRSAEDQPTFISRDDAVQTPADFAYGSGVSEEGVEITLDSDTERSEDVPLDEGIPNLGEPGELSDDPGQTEESITSVADDVAEDFGQSEATDSISYDDRWVGDTTTQADQIPGASRGLADDNEVSGEELDIEDTDDTGELGLFEDTEPSGSGGEVDLANDESPAFDESEMSIVDSPDDPVGEDEGGPQGDELTLGLRDSETAGPDAGDQAGMTGEVEVTDEMDVLPPEPTDVVEGDASGEALLASVIAGDQPAGLRGEDDMDSEEADVEQIVDSNKESRERYLSGDAAEPDIPSRTDGDHLGTTGTFEEAHETETIPAAPAAEEEDVVDDASGREAYVTGDEADGASEAEPGDTNVDDITESGNDRGGYSAAWSSPAGVVDEMTSRPSMSAESPEDERQPGESRSTDEITEPDDAGILPDVGGDDLAEAGVDALTGEDDDVGSAVEDAGPSEEEEPGPGVEHGDSPVDTSAGYDVVSDPERVTEPTTPPMAADDPETAAADAAGDLGTPTGQPDQPVPPEKAAEQAGRSEQDRGTRRSRRERRQQSDWVPAGAVRGEGGACPTDYPIKGNANSRIYHLPSDPSYGNTVPAYCFATEEDARKAGFRAPRGN